MPDRYATFRANKKVYAPFIETPSGGDDGGKPVALDPATGKIHPGFVADTAASIVPVQASETIANRRIVTSHNVSGNQRIRPALATYDRRAFGHVSVGGNSGDVLSVQTSGEVTMDIGSTGVTAADVNVASVFLDPVNAGLVTKTAPSTTGQIRQYLGHIVGINTGAGTFTFQLTVTEPEELA
jgi:hypothetical protein